MKILLGIVFFIIVFYGLFELLFGIQITVLSYSFTKAEKELVDKRVNKSAIRACISFVLCIVIAFVVAPILL